MLRNDVYRIHVFHCMVWNIMQDKLEKYCKSIYSKLQLPLIQWLFCSCEKPFKALQFSCIKADREGRLPALQFASNCLQEAVVVCVVALKLLVSICNASSIFLGVWFFFFFSSASIFSVQSVHSKCGSYWVVRMPMSFKVSIRNQSSKYFSSKL